MHHTDICRKGWVGTYLRWDTAYLPASAYFSFRPSFDAVKSLDQPGESRTRLRVHSYERTVRRLHLHVFIGQVNYSGYEPHCADGDVSRSYAQFGLNPTDGLHHVVVVR